MRISPFRPRRTPLSAAGAALAISGGLVALSVSAAALAISRLRRSRVRFTCHVQGGQQSKRAKPKRWSKPPSKSKSDEFKEAISSNPKSFFLKKQTQLQIHKSVILIADKSQREQKEFRLRRSGIETETTAWKAVVIPFHQLLALPALPAYM